MPLTIKEAALRAIEILNRPSSLDEIYTIIIENNLYVFNTDVPKHVLRTTIKRHCLESERVDSFDEILFSETKDEQFFKLERPEARRMRTPGSKRIHRAKDKEEIISDLTSSDFGVFREIWRLLMFAAALGFKNERREALESVDQGKGIDQATFGNCPTWPGLLYLFALNETQSEEVMRSTDEAEDMRIKVFEEYANGGLSILREHFHKRDFDLTTLVELSSQIVTPSELPKPDLSI